MYYNENINNFQDISLAIFSIYRSKFVGQNTTVISLLFLTRPHNAILLTVRQLMKEVSTSLLVITITL